MLTQALPTEACPTPSDQGLIRRSQAPAFGGGFFLPTYQRRRCRRRWAGHPKLVKTVLSRTRTTQTMTETTVLDFKLSNTFEEYRAHMNAPEQQAMFTEMGVKTFFIGVCKDDPQRATVMFQGPEDVLYNIFTNPETKPIVEASGHIYEGTVITRWLA